MPIVDLTIDSNGAVKALGKYDNAVNNSGKNTAKAFSKIRASANGLGAGVGVALAAGVTAVAAFSVKAINAASDMEETQGKFDVVFRNLGDYAENAAKRISDSYGMSKRESKLYMSSLQDLLVPSGLARDKAAEMSIAFTELAADLGSFNNMETSTVVRDIQSSLAGGSETMTKYSIDVKVAAVKAEMLALGLDTSTKAAERQSRTVALLSIMQRDSSDAMGDFARTQASYANQLKIAKSKIDDMVVSIGQQLLPMATKAITTFNEWITTNGRLQTILTGLVSIAQFFHAAWNGINVVLHGTVLAIAKTVGAFNKVLIPLDLIFKAAVKLKAIDKNPLDGWNKGVDDFVASAEEGLSKAIAKAADTHMAYERVKLEILATGDAATESSKKISQGNGNVKASTEQVVGALKKEFEAITLVNGVYTLAQADSVAAQKSVKEATDDVTGALNKEYEAITLVDGVYVLAEEHSIAAKKSVEKTTSAIAKQSTEVGTLAVKETEVSEQVKKVTDNAIKSSEALTKQADTANKVAAAVDNIANANQRTSATAEGTYRASKAWSGGKSSMGSAPAMTPAEMEYFKSKTPAGRGDHYFNKGRSHGPLGGSDDPSSNLDLILQQKEQAISDIYAAREANGGKPVTNITNIFNQSISTFDVTNIMEEQQRQAARE